MDYLDPQKKKAHKRRIAIGYGLFAVVIAFATIVLLFLASGYDIDRDTGEVIQNGLLFVDSQPGNADILLNGELQGTQTDARLVVPAGSYEISIAKPGYRPWSRTLQLDGGSLRRITYPKLIPETLLLDRSISIRTEPLSVLQSPNDRIILMAHAENPAALTFIDLSQAVVVPQAILVSDGTLDQEIESPITLLEWSDDNRQVLASYQLDDVEQFILIDTLSPETSVNITEQLEIPGATIQLRGGASDQYYVYTPGPSFNVQVASASAVQRAPIAQDILQFDSARNDWMAYVVFNIDDPMKIDVRLQQGDEDILLLTTDAADSYMLQIAERNGQPLVVFARADQERTYVYSDPLQFLRDNQASIPVPTTVLRTVNTKQVSVSPDGSIVLAMGTDSIASYELDVDRLYRASHDELDVDLERIITWADGQHYVLTVGDGMQIVSDFDGSNRYPLASSKSVFGSLFSANFELLYTLSTPSQDAVDAGDAQEPASVLQMNIYDLVSVESQATN